MMAPTNLAGPEPKDLVTAGISTRYYTGGKGEPLLLSRPRRLVRELGRADAGSPPPSVIAVDLPGHAGS